MVRKALNIVSYCTLFATTILIIAMLYLMFFHGSNPVTFNEYPLQVDKEVYAPGDAVTITADFCKHGDYPVDGRYTLKNHFAYHYPTTYSSMPAGCTVFSDSSHTIPTYAEEGEYHFDIMLEYHVNKFRTVVVQVETETFQVKK